MVGIANLPQQQGQMMAPGQAPMPGMGQPMQGMMPKPGAATPAAEVNQYAGMQLPQLIAQFQQRPSGPLLGLITKQAEAMELQKAQANQAAMAQAQQQQGTVTDMAMGKALQAMQPTRMAAHGGIMQGYAGGGAVSFKDGGDVQKFSGGADEEGVQSFMSRFPKDSGARMLYEWIKAGRPALEKPILDALLQKEQQVAAAPTGTTVSSGPTRQGKSGIADLDIGPSMAPVQRTGAPAPAPAPAGPRMQAAAAAPSVLPAETPLDTTAYRQRVENAASDIRTGMSPSEKVLAGRQGLAALAGQNIAEQRKEAQDAEAAAKAELERRLQYTRSSPFSDAQSLFRMAAAIDPRRGKGMGSFSSGIAGEMEKRTAAGEEAQKAFATSQEATRQRNALVRQAQFLEATRAHAEAVGDDATERQARQQLATLYTDLEKFNVDVQQKNRQQALERYQAESQRMGAQAQMKSAGKPTAQEALRSWFESDPKGFSAFIEAQNEPKSAAAMRKSLMEQWGKNLMLQQKFPNFEDFVTTMTPPTGGAGAGGGEFKVLSSRPKT